MSWRAFPVLLLVATALSGCLAGEDVDPDSARQGDAGLPFWFEDGLFMDVAVPVILIGFSEAAQDFIARDLAAGERVVQFTGDLAQPLPPGEDLHLPLEETMSMRLPIVPTARYEVVTLGAEIEAQIAEKLANWTVEGSVLEGRELEAFLAATLYGTAHEPDRNAPSIVLFKGDSFLDDYSWRYSMPHGHLEPVAAFGEYAAMHIIDTTKQGVALEHLGKHVREATHYRVLQGPAYPMPLPECHALTLVTAYRPTSLSEINPDMATALELLHPEEIASAFQNLTGTTVHVDTINLALPMDDPALDLLARGEFGTVELQRAWIAEHWQDYWVAHEGCEAYVSFLIHTDAASTPTPVLGIGTYDHGKGYRIALSWVNDLLRLVFDPASPLAPVADELSVPVGNLGDDSLERFNWVDYLHAHEAGHLFGMMHPHHLVRDGVESRTDWQDVWSVMSYSTDGRVIDFGMVDQANFQRNRMGFLFHAANELGLLGEPQVAAAIEIAAEYQWNEANAVLWELVAPQMSRVGGSLQPYPAQDGMWFQTASALHGPHGHAHG